MRRLLLALTVLLAPAAAVAQAMVEMPWARATAPTARAGGAFMTISSSTAERLIGAESPVAEIVELHETVEEAGVMKMKAVPVLLLRPGQPVTLKPGSYHVMLIGLKAPLKQGEAFPITLRFAAAPPMTIQVPIAAAGAAGPAAHSH